MPMLVSVTIVTYNSRRFIGPCLESVFELTGVPLEVVVVDNVSTDGTQQVLASFEDRVRIIHNKKNTGFAAAQNQAIAASSGDWVLTLNPDVILMPDFLIRLIEASEIDSTVGTVCGKLLSISDDLVPSIEPRLDSAGMFFTPEIRHFDRGWSEPDDGRFQQMEYVFGASAAAALYRRDMIGDISEAGEFFDPDFFAYREDADVAWRAQLLGWRCVYTPDAVGYHVRRVVAGNRSAVPPVLNMHSVKNRFLMRIKNMTGDLYRRHWVPVTVRDVLVAGGCLLCEQTSLPAFWHVAKAFRRALRQRKRIMSRRRVTDESLAQWFSAEPSTQRVPEMVLPLKYRASA
jgi:GT2 family glycosyltransferase